MLNPSPALLGRFRFRLRTLLLAVAVLSLILAHGTLVIAPWYRDLNARIGIQQFGAQVATEPHGQFLLRQFAGDALSERATYVHLKGTRIDDVSLANLAVLRHIEVLSINSPNVSDHGLIHLRALPKLRSLTLVNTQVSEDGLAALREALPNLRLVERRALTK